MNSFPVCCGKLFSADILKLFTAAFGNSPMGLFAPFRNPFMTATAAFKVEFETTAAFGFHKSAKEKFYYS
jgi:hypothetical protein